MEVKSGRRQDTSEPLTQNEAAFGTREWLDYFERNANELLPISWDAGPELTDEEKRVITKSVQIFQLGESSEGRHLSKCAKDYSSRSGDLAYYEVIRLFIREEQRHARELGRFLEINGIPLIRKTFSDSVFRRLRKPAGLELSVAVLVTAEIVAQVYYPALQDATQSSILRGICDQIIRDETPHVQFQCERLSILRKRHSTVRRWATLAAQRLLMFGTSFVVWSQHRRVFRSAGHSFVRFWSDLWTAYRAAEGIMREQPNRKPAET